MRILFLHRNFPAQFSHLATLLAMDPSNHVAFLTNRKEGDIKDVNKHVYELARPVNPEIHQYLRFYEDVILHGQAALRLALQLRDQGFVPDIIFGHSWGPTIFMKEVFPKTPFLGYFEWFYHSEGSDVGFDKNDPTSMDLKAKIRVKNSHLLTDLDSSDHGISPTYWQQSQFPKEYQSKISVIHDGINTEFFKPNPENKLVIPEINLDLSEVSEIVTYVARGMEPYRGFPQFMEAAALILEKRPNAHIVIVGDDRVSYGKPLPDGKTYKQFMLEKLSLDLSRVHFTGSLPYHLYLKVLQASSVHVYLTYPFVLSWSALEAMSTGCVIVGSSTPPVKEVIQDGVNGLLVDFFSPEEIAGKICEVLDHPDRMAKIREEARKTIQERYDLKDMLTKQIELLNNIIEKHRKTIT